MAWARINVRTKKTVDDAFLDKLDGGSEVLRAVRHGDIKRLKEIFAREPEAREAKGHMGRRPLHIAVENEQLDLIGFLIEAGVNVNGTRDSGDTPLFWASTAEIAAILIGAGASIHAQDFSGREPIHWAAQFARSDVLRLYLDRGCEVNIRDGRQHTPLHWATGASKGMFMHICDMTDPRAFDCVRLLVERGADVNARSIEGNVPLHGVAVMPNMEQRLLDGTLKFLPEIPGTILSIARFLLEHNADPTIKNLNGVSPIEMASEETRAEMSAWTPLKTGDSGQ